MAGKHNAEWHRADLSVGSFHVCGRTQAGLVYCWGVYFDSTTPMRLPFQEPYQP